VGVLDRVDLVGGKQRDGRGMMAEERIYTDDMGEISGFGGGYEQACRAMALAGLAWWDEHPEATPRFHSYNNVTGLCIEDNDDAKALTEAILAACREGSTGAMHEAAVSHVMFARAHGWAKYAEELRAREHEGETG
jgi:hypothetical protein